MAMVARFWGLKGQLLWSLYSGELGVRHANPKTKSISSSRLESLISFRVLERDKIGLVWL
jgi:hypothetical protein